VRQPHTSASPLPAASPSPRDTIVAWLELARLSNLPTVLTNVLVGIAAAATSPELAGEAFAWSAVLPLFLALGLLYTSGMMLNDVADAHIDTRERPGRPIPSGRIRSNHALLAAIACMLAGTLLLIMAGTPPRLAFALPAAIIAYDLAHRRFAASALFMGACRGLVYLVAAAALVPQLPQAAWVLGGLVAVYTTVVTLISQREIGLPDTPRRVLSLVPALIVVPALIAAGGHGADSFAITITAILAMAWLARAPVFILNDPPRTKDAVLTLLSGMCLLDLFFLTVLGAPAVAMVAAGACFILTVLLHRRISGT
jgi:4-hydroxybenzoate polyprenyltransferase